MPTDLESVGFLASQLRIPVSSILNVAMELGIVPAMRLNEVQYLSAAQRQRIAKALAANQRKARVARRRPQTIRPGGPMA